MSSASLGDHLNDLRGALLWSLGCIVIATVFAFACHQPIIKCLSKLIPYQDRVALQPVRYFNNDSTAIRFTLPEGASLLNLSSGATINSDEIEMPPGTHVDLIEPMRPILLNPADGFMVAFRVSFWAGLALSSPFWLYFLLEFITPGLHTNEKKIVFPFLLLTVLFLFLGLAFAFFISIPITNQTLFAFNEELGTNLWSLSQYLNFVLALFVANCIAFELSGILLLLVHIGLCTHAFLSQKRPYVIVAVFIVAALLTPPDVVTQLLLAGPLLLLYELTASYAWIRQSMGFCPLLSK